MNSTPWINRKINQLDYGRARGRSWLLLKNREQTFLVEVNLTLLLRKANL